MFEVKIYGEILPTKMGSSEDFEYSCLSILQEQLSEAKGEPLLVRINSPGGDATGGLAMYNELRRYAAKNGVDVTTFGEAHVESIATIIFLAGDKRILTNGTQPFVHNAWCYAEGDAGTLKRVSDNLEMVSVLLSKHYSEHTDLTVEEARELMDNETYITAEEAVNMRFATEIEAVNRPKALRKFTNTNLNMSKGKDFVKAFRTLMGAIKAKIVKSADEKDVNFTDLTDDETPKVGDKATIDGAPANGDIVMKSGETYVFVDGELTEIKEVVEEPEEEADAVALKEENEELTVALGEAVNMIKSLTGKYDTLNASYSKALKDSKREPETGTKKQPKSENKAGAALAKLKEVKQNLNKK